MYFYAPLSSASHAASKAETPPPHRTCFQCIADRQM
jgi:hypothetical protein